jgi:hypothetical protein
MVGIWPRIQDLTTDADRQWSAIKAKQDTIPQASVHLVCMVMHYLVVTAFLLHYVAFFPNLFTKDIPITWKLTAKVASYRVRHHCLILLLRLHLRLHLRLNLDSYIVLLSPSLVAPSSSSLGITIMQ